MGRVLHLGPSWHGPSWFWAELSCTPYRVSVSAFIPSLVEQNGSAHENMLVMSPSVFGLVREERTIKKDSISI